MLAAMHVLAELGGTDADRTLSGLTAQFSRYAGSGEINSTVTDQAERLRTVEAVYAGRDGVTIDHLDGLTVRFADRGWFNLRPSNTEPLLRLNAEAADPAAMGALRDEVLALVRAGS
jgi:phosphomannomutase